MARAQGHGPAARFPSRAPVALLKGVGQTPGCGGWHTSDMVPRPNESEFWQDASLRSVHVWNSFPQRQGSVLSGAELSVDEVEDDLYETRENNGRSGIHARPTVHCELAGNQTRQRERVHSSWPGSSRQSPRSLCICVTRSHNALLVMEKRRPTAFLWSLCQTER